MSLLSPVRQARLANPNFLAVYGLEWGVISNGGHLNILNSTELLHWEYNASNQLQGDAYTAKTAYDTLKAQVRNTSGTVLATLATYSNLNKGTSYVQKSLDLSAYKGQTVQVYFTGTEGTMLQTTFLVDDVALTVQ